MSNALSKRQAAILDCIRTNIATFGYPPTYRELCQATGLKSTASVYANMQALERKGYITQDAGKPRAVAISGEEEDSNIDAHSAFICDTVRRMASGAISFEEAEQLVLEELRQVYEERKERTVTS